jgi:hypothetical protein
MFGSQVMFYIFISKAVRVYARFSLPMSGTQLSEGEFCDSLAIRYGSNPTGLQPTCDGCGAAFSARHAFACAKGGLVIIRHNKIRD